MTDENYFIEQFQTGVPVIAIFRGMSPQQAVEQAQQAWALGVRLVEVTLQDDGGYEALRAVVDAAPEGVDVGAGTVTTAEQLERAVDAGARFGIAPGLDAETVTTAVERLQVPFLPGVATASEVQTAQNLGVTAVKVFPASVLTPAWLTAMTGPFPRMRFIATGGVDAANARAFLEAGAAGIGASGAPGSDRFERLCAELTR